LPKGKKRIPSSCARLVWHKVPLRSAARRERIQSFFGSLINAVGCVLIIPCDIEPNIDEIVLSRWRYWNRLFI
jgi:hypothetical protein